MHIKHFYIIYGEKEGKKTTIHNVVKTSHQRCRDILTDKVRHILLLIIIKKKEEEEEEKKKKRKEMHVRIASTRPLKKKKTSSNNMAPGHTASCFFTINK